MRAIRVELVHSVARRAPAAPSHGTRWRRSADAESERDNIPFGSQLASDGRALEHDDGEQATIRRIAAMREARISLKGIARTLSEEKNPARGSRWHPITIARIGSRTSEVATFELDPNAPEWVRRAVDLES